MVEHEDIPLAHAGMAAEIELQQKYYEEGKVFILQIESTLRCKQECNYCYAGSTPTSSHGLSSARIKQLIDSASDLDIKMIDWLGGDPLERDDWFELCGYASKKGLINNIWTSGIPLANEEIAEKVVKITKKGFLSIHLDTKDPQLYQQLHGSSGSKNVTKNINLIIKGIENILEKGKNPGSIVNCITYTTPLASGNTKEMILYMQQTYGIKTCLTLFNPVIFRNGNEDWEPTPNQINDAFSYRDAINYPDDPSCGTMDVSKFYCGTVICVTSSGWVTPCSVIRTKEFGNIKQLSLKEIIKRTKRRLLFLDFRNPENLPGKCGSCNNNSFCFGCRSSAYYYNGDILAEDPKCQNYQKLRDY